MVNCKVTCVENFTQSEFTAAVRLMVKNPNQPADVKVAVALQLID
jgi:hypothetical protein